MSDERRNTKTRRREEPFNRIPLFFFELLCLCGLSFAAVPASAGSEADSLARESALRLEAGDASGAALLAGRAAAADPRSASALRQLARAANAARDFAAAEAAASRALEIAGPAPTLFCLRSEARSARGNFLGALQDARAAAALAPSSAEAALRRAAAQEGLGHAAAALADYRRAAELDPGFSPLRDAARARLAPRPGPRPDRRRLAPLIFLPPLLAAWAWLIFRRREPAAGAAAPLLGGRGRVEPREALRLLAAAAPAAADAERTLALAEALYERLIGRPPYPPGETVAARSLGLFVPPSRAAEGLPPGLDAFFARALDPDPSRRFRSGAELERALRSVVDPAVEGPLGLTSAGGN